MCTVDYKSMIGGYRTLLVMNSVNPLLIPLDIWIMSESRHSKYREPSLNTWQGRRGGSEVEAKESSCQTKPLSLSLNVTKQGRLRGWQVLGTSVENKIFFYGFKIKIYFSLTWKTLGTFQRYYFYNMKFWYVCVLQLWMKVGTIWGQDRDRTDNLWTGTCLFTMMFTTL